MGSGPGLLSGRTLAEIATASRRRNGNKRQASLHSELAKRNIELTHQMPGGANLEQLLQVQHMLSDFRASENAALALDLKNATDALDASQASVRALEAGASMFDSQIAQARTAQVAAENQAAAAVELLRTERASRTTGSTETERILEAIREMKVAPAAATPPLEKAKDDTVTAQATVTTGATAIAPRAKNYEIEVIERDLNGYGTRFKIKTS